MNVATRRTAAGLLAVGALAVWLPILGGIGGRSRAPASREHEAPALSSGEIARTELAGSLDESLRVIDLLLPRRPRKDLAELASAWYGGAPVASDEADRRTSELDRLASAWSHRQRALAPDPLDGSDRADPLDGSGDADALDGIDPRGARR